MGYHILEPIRGSPDAPHILFWKRLGIDYDLPIIPRSEAIPPNRLRLIVVKTVNDAGEPTRDIGEAVEWDFYEPYGPAAVEPYGSYPPEEVMEQHRTVDDDELVEQIAGKLPVPQAFYHEHHLELGDYAEIYGDPAFEVASNDYDLD